MEFLARLRAYGVDEPLVAALGRELDRRVEIARGDCLIAEGAAAARVFFVEEGWLGIQSALADGSTVIADLALPGEIAGLGELAWDRASNDTIALTPVRAVVMSRARLGEILETVPGAAGLMLTLKTMRSAASGDRHVMTLRADGRARLLYLFLDLHARQSVAAPRDWIEMPLTQHQIADLVGLTNVHVSGLLKQLEGEGHLERRRGALRLRGVEALRAETGFRDRWTRPDFGWTGALGETGARPAGQLVAPGAAEAERTG